MSEAESSRSSRALVAVSRGEDLTQRRRDHREEPEEDSGRYGLAEDGKLVPPRTFCEEEFTEQLLTTALTPWLSGLCSNIVPKLRAGVIDPGYNGGRVGYEGGAAPA